MHSSLIGKVEKANRYARELDRISLERVALTFRGDNDTHHVSLDAGHTLSRATTSVGAHACISSRWRRSSASCSRRGWVSSLTRAAGGALSALGPGPDHRNAPRGTDLGAPATAHATSVPPSLQEWSRQLPSRVVAPAPLDTLTTPAAGVPIGAVRSCGPGSGVSRTPRESSSGRHGEVAASRPGDLSPRRVGPPSWRTGRHPVASVERGGSSRAVAGSEGSPDGQGRRAPNTGVAATKGRDRMDRAAPGYSSGATDGGTWMSVPRGFAAVRARPAVEGGRPDPPSRPPRPLPPAHAQPEAVPRA
jgi:hypothetical protein